jgi:hypothetical protein
MFLLTLLFFLLPLLIPIPGWGTLWGTWAPDQTPGPLPRSRFRRWLGREEPSTPDVRYRLFLTVLHRWGSSWGNWTPEWVGEATRRAEKKEVEGYLPPTQPKPRRRGLGGQLGLADPSLLIT